MTHVQPDDDPSYRPEEEEEGEIPLVPPAAAAGPTAASTQPMIQDEPEEDIGDQGELAVPGEPGADDGVDPDIAAAMAHLDPNSTILAPVQRRLKKQLTEQLTHLFLELKEVQEGVKRQTESRESIGVELYTRQQQLAQLHESKERLDDNLATIRRVRGEVEQRRDEFVGAYEERKKDLGGHDDALGGLKRELERVNAALRQVTKDNSVIESEIAVRRRKTYKTEEQMSALEREKRSQDYLLDRFHSDAKDLQQRTQLVLVRCDAQKKETERAREVLAETKTEMEALAFRKKTLLQEWKSLVIGMQKRDETLERIHRGLEEQSQHRKEIENEVEGYHASISKERDLMGDLMKDKMKHQNEQVYLARQIKTTEEKIDQRHQEYGQLRGMLDGIEVEVRSLTGGLKKKLSEIDTVRKQVLKIANEVRQLEHDELEVLSNQTTYKKGEQSTRQMIEKVRERITDREIDQSNVENEIARINIDILQTNNRNAQLRTVLDDLLRELKERDKMIEKYRFEIKKKHDEIEKKQSTLDKLNRELERLKANQQEENYGPLEATIHNLQKLILQKEKDNEVLNKNWIRQQSELVDLMNRSEVLHDRIRELNARRTVLNQKHLRLEGVSTREKKETSELGASIKHLHDDTVTLNSLIAQHAGLQAELADQNYDLQNAIIARIRKKEAETKAVDELVKTVMAEKRKLIGNLLEIEKQIMFWEKKIELQKEIQSTLDPEVGQDEIKWMKKEIHVMEQRLVDMKREQKMKVHLMERAVAKRGIILMKGKAQRKRKVNTKASMQREVKSMMDALSRKKIEKRRRMAEMKKLIQEAAAVGTSNDEHSRAIRLSEHELRKCEEEIAATELEIDILNAKYRKEVKLVSAVQKKAIRHVAPEAVSALREAVTAVVSDMRTQFPVRSAKIDLIGGYLQE